MSLHSREALLVEASHWVTWVFVTLLIHSFARSFIQQMYQVPARII